MLTTALMMMTLSGAGTATEPLTLKLGSLAPRESPWGQILRVWGKAVKEKTGGQVALDFYWNGTQGDENAMDSRMSRGGPPFPRGKLHRGARPASKPSATKTGSGACPDTSMPMSGSPRSPRSISPT